MARADLILSLIRAGTRGDQVQFHKTVEALAAEERAKNHGILADRLLAQIETNNGVIKHTEELSSRQSANSLFFESIPRRCLEDLILPTPVEETVRELIEEQLRAGLLRSYNLEPRNRILLAGPPGNGKTTLAEAIADSLNVPFIVVRYESVIGSYLGETAQRIGQVFEHARSRHCVLFFDEFDSVGKERGDRHETGEIKRVVSSLLLQVDALPSYVVIVTASNHPELLDRAVWRRFQVRPAAPPAGPDSCPPALSPRPWRNRRASSCCTHGWNGQKYTVLPGRNKPGFPATAWSISGRSPSLARLTTPDPPGTPPVVALRVSAALTGRSGCSLVSRVSLDGCAPYRDLATEPWFISRLAGGSLTVVLAVFHWTAVGSEAGGPQVLAGEGIGAHSPGTVSTRYRELAPPG